MRPERHLVAIALGSNLGDRAGHLTHALDRLRERLADMVVSPFSDTEPVGVAPQGRFLNGALAGVWQGTARDLLDYLREVEEERGRERPHPGAPRTLDLDLILFGEAVINEPGLIVPHPRFRERLFVLRPLAAIAPEMIDPVTGLTIRQLLVRASQVSSAPPEASGPEPRA
jgi:2-amino-4-hydroxy-6-hydroxymethyldihydropteridine diphosphokinase